MKTVAKFQDYVRQYSVCIVVSQMIQHASNTRNGSDQITTAIYNKVTVQTHPVSTQHVDSLLVPSLKSFVKVKLSFLICLLYEDA